MTRVDEERNALRARPLDTWETYLLGHSGLPGPRGNLELLAAFVEEAPTGLIEDYARLSAEEAPAGTAREFLAVCGAAGTGRLLEPVGADASSAAFERLRLLASDPRWRVREGVAIGLQRFGRAQFPELVAEMERWAGGALLERRAVVAALCEPVLLHDPGAAETVLGLLDRITASVAAAPAAERRTDPFRVLRQALGYGWSVAIAARPARGVPTFRRWVESPDRDVAWIVRENLSKKRLAGLAVLEAS